MKLVLILLIVLISCATPTFANENDEGPHTVVITSAVPYDPRELAMPNGRWMIFERSENYVEAGVGGLDGLTNFIDSISRRISEIGGSLYQYIRQIIASVPSVFINFYQMSETIFRFPAEKLGSAVMNALKEVFTKSISTLSDQVALLLATLYTPTLPNVGGSLFNNDVMRVIRDGIRGVILIVLALAMLSLLLKLLHAMLNHSSHWFGLAAEEMVRLSLIMIIAFNAHTIVDATFVIINQMVSNLCGDTCGIGSLIAGLVLPVTEGGGRQAVATHATDFVSLLFAPIVLVMLIFSGIVYTLAKLLLAGYVLLFAPLFIALAALPYGETVFAGWIDAIKRLLMLVAISIVVGLIGDGVIASMGLHRGADNPIIVIAGMGTGMVMAATLGATAVHAATNLGANAVLITAGHVIARFAGELPPLAQPLLNRQMATNGGGASPMTGMGGMQGNSQASSAARAPTTGNSPHAPATGLGVPAHHPVPTGNATAHASIATTVGSTNTTSTGNGSATVAGSFTPITGNAANHPSPPANGSGAASPTSAPSTLHINRIGQAPVAPPPSSPHPTVTNSTNTTGAAQPAGLKGDNSV